MSTSTRIVQISDCHLPANPEQTYRGINPLHHLVALIPKVKALKPDLLLATGDLSEDGSRVSYQVLQEIFMPLGIPVLALPGNHDDPQLLADAFPGSPVDSIETSSHGPWQIIRLNSWYRLFSCFVAEEKPDYKHHPSLEPPPIYKS